MNLAEKPHQDADSAVSSIHRWSAVFRIRKPFLSEFITASRDRVVPLGYTFSAMLGVLLIVCGYVLGSVPTGLLVGRAFGVDVLEVGSGNIGMANVLRAAGKWPAALTMLGDLLKGFVPVVLARAITDNRWIIAAVALAAVVGACWSVFLGFKGGKAVATGAGTSIGLALPVGLVLFALWWIV